uniref:Cytochrome c oxidase subunit 4 n=1 Tax=Zonotrichia albicollis TaxID=44394 RepID=A0A8D2N3H1_ZONAL
KAIPFVLALQSLSSLQTAFCSQAMLGAAPNPLYRIKFNESYAEMKKGTNEWKTILGGVLFFLGLTGVILIWQKHFMYGAVPHTFSDEWVSAQTKRMLDMRVNPVQGITAQWDFDKNEWKK